MTILKEGNDILLKPSLIPHDKEKPKYTKKKKGSTLESQALLDEAANLPAFYDSPGDDFAEHMRTTLGELIKANLLAREWVAETSDLFQPECAYHGSRLGSGRTSLYDLNIAKLSASSLTILPPEVNSLNQAIILVEHINVSTSSLFKAVKFKDGEGEDGEFQEGLTVEGLILSSQKKDVYDERPTMEDVSELLKLADTVAIEIPSKTFLQALYDQANDLVVDIGRFIDRAAACKTRTKARSVGDSAKSSIEDANALRSRMGCFPLDIGLLLSLDAIIDEGVEWRREVQAIGSHTSGGRAGSRSRDEGNKGASIKRVEQLINMGEKMLFDFASELEILKDRRTQAKEWLDRLKNSFKPKSKSALRKGNPDGIELDANGQPKKMALADMRMMVEEGAELLDDQVDSRSQTSRELGKAQSVLNVAEEWLSRVRGALANGGRDMTTSDIEELKELIGESDDMPVYMEEAVVLRSHFNAMEWAKKARKVLYSNPPLPPAAQRTEAERIEAERMAAGNANTEAQGEGGGEGMEVVIKEEDETDPYREFAQPKLSELQKIAKEITKIREAVPVSVQREFALEPLIEEKDCLRIVNAVETWNSQAKRVTQGGGIKRGTKLDKCRKLYVEGATFAVNFQNELKPFRVAIINAENWIKDNADSLKMLGIPVNVERTIVEDDESSCQDESQGNGMAVDGAGAVEVQVKTDDVADIVENGNSLENFVSYGVLQRLCVAGESVVLDSEELSMAMERRLDVDHWILKMKEVCTAEDTLMVGKRNQGGGPSSGYVNGSGNGNGYRKKAKAVVRREDLVALIEEADSLRVNLSSQKKTVQVRTSKV